MLRRLESWPDWKAALGLTAALRILYSAIAAALSFVLAPDPARIHSNALTGNLPAPGTLYYALAGVWERFDTLWYLRIAQHGYDLPRAVIFYPLYPAAIRVASTVMPPVMAALFVSTLAAFVFLWGLLRLARAASPPSARLRTVLLVLAWPTSFILFAGYAESLLLALLVWAVLLAREQRWSGAAVCGVLASMCRPSGVLVAIPLALLALRGRQWKSIIVLLTPLGLLAYWGWLRSTGRLSVVEAYRVYQGSSFAPPWDGLREALHLIVSERDELLAIKLALVVLMAAFSLRREVRLEDKLFACAVILQMMMYTGRPLLAAARYLLPVYPAFIALGSYAARRWSDRQLAFFLAAFSIFNLVWFGAFLDWSLVF